MTQQELVLSAEFFLRILTAAVCGIVIGYERENRNKEAGIRTHAIVALGAALIMMLPGLLRRSSAASDSSAPESYSSGTAL